MTGEGTVEIIPAVLRNTWEGIQEDWNRVVQVAQHVHVDVTDGVFAGAGSFRDVRQFKKLSQSEKIELHLMVHNPGHYVDDILDLQPARVVFHIEAFSDGGHLDLVYKKLRESSGTELGLGITPPSPVKWLFEQVPLLDFVQFLNVIPGYQGGTLDKLAFQRMGHFRERYPEIPIAVDGGVNKETIPAYLKAGATMLCSGSAVFAAGDPAENIAQLRLIAEGALE